MDIEDKKENKFPVRCPFQRLSKADGKLYRCNSLCGRIKPNGAGELRCNKCRLLFDFEVDSQGIVSTFVNVKPVK